MGLKKQKKVGALAEEFAGSDLGDTRRGQRLSKIVDRFSSAPDESFPTLFSDNSELEALYRFTGNEKIDWKAVWEPHRRQTLVRCMSGPVVRIAHDTTDFIFSGDRDGLGVVLGSAKGFFLHAALAISGNEERMPLGVLGMVPYIRTRERGMKTLNVWKAEARKRPRAQKESSRWEKLAIEVNELIPPEVKAIHVMDQEADDFTLMGLLSQAGVSFVIRGSSQRQTAGNRSGPLQESLDTLAGHAFRDIRVSRRTAAQAQRNSKVHPPREERVAKLELRWGEVRLPKPQHAQTEVQSLSVSVVQVFEPEPPPGEAPISWTLFTTESVRNAEEAVTVVDHYRARWVIEEYFKSLKTGCAFQERQLTTFASLVRMLAIIAPIAWHLLLVRSLGRREKSPAATTLFLAEQLLVLAALYKDRCKRQLPKAPTVTDAMLAIAQLGGHLKRNGAPGWQTLGRGMERFRTGWETYLLFQALKM